MTAAAEIAIRKEIPLSAGMQILSSFQEGGAEALSDFAHCVPHIRWLREYWATVEPHTHGFYTNDASDVSQQKMHRNYGGNYDRLLALKNKYDPTNLFRLNANIVPTV